MVFVGLEYNNGSISGVQGNGSGNPNHVDNGNLVSIVLQQIGFWSSISFAGGIVAEIATKAAGIFDTVPWE